MTQNEVNQCIELSNNSTMQTNENLQLIEKYQKEYQIINLEKEIRKDELIDKKI